MKTVAGEYKRRRKAGTAAEQYRAKREAAPKATPATPPKPQAPPPPATVDTRHLEQVVMASSREMHETVQKLSAALEGLSRSRNTGVSVEVTSRDSRGNIKTLSIKPERPQLH